MHGDFSIHPNDRWGLNSPDKGTVIHMCCVFSGYHGVAAHVKQNHDIYATANQNKKLPIQSQQKTWSIFAETFEAEARDFGISCPKYTLPAIMQWHLNYEGPKLSVADVDVSQDPLVLSPVTSSNSVDLTYDPLGPHHFQAIVQMPEPPTPS